MIKIRFPKKRLHIKVKDKTLNPKKYHNTRDSFLSTKINGIIKQPVSSDFLDINFNFDYQEKDFFKIKVKKFLLIRQKT